MDVETMRVVFWVLVYLFGSIALFSWMMAFTHCKEKPLIMFTGFWILKPELFDEKGNYYRKVFLYNNLLGIIVFLGFVSLN